VPVAVQGAPVSGQLLGMIVDRIDQGTRRDVRLGVEDQIVPKLPHLLKICGDGCGPRFLAPPPLLLLLVAFAAARFSAFVMPQQKRFRARCANYRSVGARNGVEPPVVTGVENPARGPSALFRFDRLQTVNQVGRTLAWKHLFGVGLVGAVLLPDLFRSAFFRRLAIFGSDRFRINEFLGEALCCQDWSGRERQKK
jgi:hypothetical protein